MSILFIVIVAIALAAFTASFWKDHTSSREPTTANTEAYVSHGQTLYASPRVMGWEHRLKIATPAALVTWVVLVLLIERYARSFSHHVPPPGK